MKKTAGTTRTIFLAGFAGGTAEVLWVALFCLASPLQSSLVSEEIARSFLPQITGLPGLVTGLVIHYLLSVLIAGIFMSALLRVFTGKLDMANVLAASAATLVVIWAANFFVVLPVINPNFVTLMPYTVTLLSKLGFGLTMGWVIVIRAGVSSRNGRTPHQSISTAG
jgi:hypothetical protein